MKWNLLTSKTGLKNDQTLVMIALGAIGQGVLQRVRQEFDGSASEAKQILTASIALKGETTEATETIDISPFDLNEYLEKANNSSLANLLNSSAEGKSRTSDSGSWEFDPQKESTGLAAFHQLDEREITPRLKALLETARQDNPQGKMRCVLVLGMECGLSTGMLLPLLYRLADDLKRHRFTIDLFLLTAERLANPDGESSALPQEQSKAFARRWEKRLLANQDWIYPGRDGQREERRFGSLPELNTYVISGRMGDSIYSEQTLISVVSTCIITLMTTNLGTELEKIRAHEADEQRTWMDSQNEVHPATLLSFNVAGVKLDILPRLFHLKQVQQFISLIAGSISKNRQTEVAALAQACLDGAHINNDGIIEALGIGRHPVSYEEIVEKNPPKEKMYGYLSTRINDNIGGLLSLEESEFHDWPVKEFSEQSRKALNSRARLLANSEEGFLPAAIYFYQSLQRILTSKRETMLDHAEWARRELGTSPTRQRLDQLLERLRADTVPVNGLPLNVSDRFGVTSTVAVPTQVRKIIQVANEVREHALIIGGSRLLEEIYLNLEEYCQQQCGLLQSKLRTLSNASSLISRQAEILERSSRAALTYEKVHFDKIVSQIMEQIELQISGPSSTDIIEKVGGDLTSFITREDEIIKKLLTVLKPDANRLTSVAQTIVSNEPLLRNAVQSAISQLHPNVELKAQVQRESDTSRRRFVICSRSYLEAHSEDFQDATWIECRNPYNVLVSDHQEGFPFDALACFQDPVPEALIPSAEQPLPEKKETPVHKPG